MDEMEELVEMVVEVQLNLVSDEVVVVQKASEEMVD